jgi:YVTN family beta-propeller protein
LYVVNGGADTISVINEYTGEGTATIKGPGHLNAIVPIKQTVGVNGDLASLPALANHASQRIPAAPPARRPARQTCVNCVEVFEYRYIQGQILSHRICTR